LFSVKPAVERTGLSEILLGVDSVSPWKPIAVVSSGQKRLGVRVEFAAADFDAAASTVKLLAGRAGQTQWIEQKNLAVTGDGPTRTASGSIDAAQLEKGRYVLKVEHWRDGVLKASTAKAIEIR
jgi:hypothetical protein